MRYASCLPVAPTVMEATLGGSGGITPDPSLETGRKYIWYEEMAENNIIIIGQERVWGYTWVKEKYPWWTDKREEDRCRPTFNSLCESRLILEQAQIELSEAMIMLHDVEVEKPTFKEIRGNPVWLRLKRRNEEAETVRREEKEERAKTKQNVSA